MAATLMLPNSPFKLSQNHRFSSPSPATHNQRLLLLRASVQQESSPEAVFQEQNEGIKKSVKVLKDAAKTRKVESQEVLAALSVIEKAKVDPSEFLQTLGGTESPGRTWMLIFTANAGLKSGRYFPVTAVQRFDADAMRIENGVYLGPLACLAFEGRISWKKRILAFIFENIRIKIGPFGPLQIDLGSDKDREPGTKDPFFIWFYIDQEIAVARGRGGGNCLLVSMSSCFLDCL